MASSVATADLRRDKIRLAVYALVFVICALICFKPIRLIDEKTFSDVYFTFRYEQSFGTSDRAKDELRATLSSKFAAWNLPADCDVSFPAANDVKVKVPAKDATEAAEFKKKLQELLTKELGSKYGKQVGEPREDLSGFPDQPLAKLGPVGLFRPRLHMKLGLDIQGGVHLVLQARTQNVQYEFKLAQTPAELRAALAAAGAATPSEPAKDEAKDAKAEPAKDEAKDAKAEPAKDEAKDATAEPAKDEAKDAKAEPAKDEAKDAKAEPAKDEAKDAKAESAKDEAKDAKADDGKQPDGGEPLRIAQATPPEGAAPTKDAAPAPAGDAPKEAEPTTLTEQEVSAEDAVAWADEALMEQVESRINEIVVQIKQKYAERDGQVMAEVVSSQTVVFRTRVDMSSADAQQQMAEHSRMILGELQRVFKGAKQIGDPQDLKIDDQKAMDDVARIVSERINRLGVSETDVRSQGNDRVVVELPGVKDPEEAVRILGTTARMEFRKVPEKYEYTSDPGPGGRSVITFKDKSAPDKVVPHQIVYYEAPEFNGDKNVLVGSHLGSNSVIVTFDQENKPAISLELNREGSARFDAFASENQNKLIAMFLDRRCIDVRSLKERHYGGKVLLTGGFATPREAKELKILLEAGALPVPVDVVEQRTVSATLGADSVNQSRRAAVAGLILILLTMVALYRMPGLLATLALIEYGMIVLAIMTLLEFTLTLPGILGFILSVGMAVDGNVISFERLKEELRESRARPIAQCIRNSYELSFDAIFDGNITTIISAAVLMALGTGPIKGFGVTLFIGTWVSMVSALYVTRTWQNLVAATKIGQNRRWYRG